MSKKALDEFITFRCSTEMKNAATRVAKKLDQDRPEAGSYARKVLREALVRRGELK